MCLEDIIVYLRSLWKGNRHLCSSVTTVLCLPHYMFGLELG